MQTKLSDITSYFAKILKQYQELHKKAQQVDAYRIVNINEKDGRCVLDIQIVGKNIVFKASPDEIAGDDRLMNCFSRQDVRTITFFACQEIKKPKYSVLLKEFCGKLNKMVFSLRSKNKKETLFRTAEEISSDEELLSNLSQKEAHLVGYMAATEKAQQDQETRQALHDTQIPKYELIAEERSEKLNTTIYTLRNKTTQEIRHIAAEDLQNDNLLLSGLDKKAIHRLGFSSATEYYTNTEKTCQALHDTKIPKYKLISEEYSNTLGKTIFTLENKTNKEIKYIAADELITDSQLHRGLNKGDLHRLGVVLGIDINKEFF